MVKAQGGDVYLDDTSNFKSKELIPILVRKVLYIYIDALTLGLRLCF